MTAKQKRKAQGTLHKFLGLKDHGPPRYFYLDWENKKALFLPDAPLVCNWQSSFQWKQQHRDICISCTLPSTKQNLITTKYPQSFVPLLKSHLQKCARRKKSDLCVKTTLELLALDPLVFFKRWCIILIEDALFDVHYPILVWMMCAVSKGYQLPKECIEWVLGYVKASSSRDYQIEFKGRKEYKIESDEWIYNLPVESRDLIYALQLRKAFGGMHCDLDMLESLSNSLLDVYKCHGSLPNDIQRMYLEHSFESKKIEKIENLDRLELNEWELASIDFHVSPILHKWKSKLSSSSSENLSLDDLKRIMWNYSAGINHRKHMHQIMNGHWTVSKVYSSWDSNSFEMDIWKQSSDFVYQLAKQILLDKFKHANDDHLL